MEIYGLTRRGRLAATMVHSPNDTEWSIIYYLARIGRSTKENIAEYCCGGNMGEATNNLKALQAKRIVAQE